MDKNLVGTWWVFKNNENRLFTYKGSKGPIRMNGVCVCRPPDSESQWLNLSELNDIARDSSGKIPENPVTSIAFLKVVDCSLLDLNPGSVIQIEIFPSGNWVMYDT